MKANAQLQSFFGNIEQLTLKYEQLKQYSLSLYNDNHCLRQENNHLVEQNDEAKSALQQIIGQLKEMQE